MTNNNERWVSQCLAGKKKKKNRALRFFANIFEAQFFCIAIPLVFILFYFFVEQILTHQNLFNVDRRLTQSPLTNYEQIELGVTLRQFGKKRSALNSCFLARMVFKQDRGAVRSRKLSIVLQYSYLNVRMLRNSHLWKANKLFFFLFTPIEIYVLLLFFFYKEINCLVFNSSLVYAGYIDSLL